MFAVAIIAVSTFLQEVSDSLGKGAVRRHLTTAYGLAFLGQFWSTVFLIGTMALGAEFVFSVESLPTFLLRLGLAVGTALVGAMAVITADRSTVGFLRSLTIPMLLGVDIFLGYAMSGWQIAGVFLMFVGLAWGFRGNPRSKNGAKLVLMSAVLGVITASLYKWNITHYNSVVGEQVVLHGCLLLLFFVLTTRQSGLPLHMLVKPWTGSQSMANGLSSTVESFAYVYAPASVIIALKRSFALFWSVMFGKRYFGEQRIRQKAAAGVVVVAGLALLALPYLQL
ncbi:hypothetical protein JNJ66_01315 [Candidatus Saccharibacteria bacterium]|nr:hypothetical protein [Candidatus Saccharibacteria bacterium]